MSRIITIVIALLFATSSIAYAEDSESSLLNLGYKYQRFENIDRDMSTREYEATYRHNQKVIDKTIGYNMGAALGLAIKDGTTLNLNESKTLGLEFKDVSKQQRALQFRIKVYW